MLQGRQHLCSCCKWWLAGEYAGTSGVDSSQAGEAGLLKPPSGRVDIATHGTPLSAGEVMLNTAGIGLAEGPRISTNWCTD